MNIKSVIGIRVPVLRKFQKNLQRRQNARNFYRITKIRLTLSLSLKISRFYYF